MTAAALTDLVPLSRLRISVLDNPTKYFEAMYNPTSYGKSFRNAYDKRQAINSTGSKQRFLVNESDQLKLKLILEGSPVATAGLITLPFTSNSVADQLANFLKIAQKMVGKRHKPNDLKISWGKMNFEGVLLSAEVTYTAFDRSGNPLRAEVDTVFEGKMKDPAGIAIKNSPDLSHSYTVMDGDTLPAIADRYYGDADLHTLIATHNALDSLRRLKTGTILSIPPIPKEDEEGESYV
jgi:Contractile injection system tube protein/LysM domain